MKKQFAIITVLLATLSGCVTTTPPAERFTTLATFDAKETKERLSEGKNTIHGSAFIRQGGGGIVTCAGGPVELVPATDYASARIYALYGSTQKGYNSVKGGKRVDFKNEPPLYDTLTRTTTCDAQGFFKFDKVADGDFYIASIVVWEVGRFNYQGGALMQRVTVKGGESKEITLTP
jgi:hypothetical protein